MKKVFAFLLVAFAVIGFMTAPSFAEALSDEQQNSLEMLLRSFGADDSTIRNFQGAVLGATTGPTDDYGADGTSTTGIYCPKLSSTMQRGARDAATGGQVTELQLFLSDYFNLNEEDIATGFFGRLTQSYVVKFQQEKGLPAFGIVGSLTRAKIAEWCGKGQTGTTGTNPVTPTTPTGTSPLPETGGGTSSAGVIAYSIVLKGGSGTTTDSFVEGTDIGPFQIVIKNNARTAQTVVFPNNCWYTYRIYDKDNGGRTVFDLSTVQQCMSAASQVPTTFTLNPGESVQIDMTHRFQTYHIPPGNYSMVFDINSRNPQRNAVKFDFKVVGKGTSTSNLYCSLATNKSSYVLGETITVKWNSNGTYAQWIKDTDKDNFYLGGDKLAAFGGTTFTANVLGNPYLVMRVYDASGATNTCRLVIPVSSVGTASPLISITSAGHVDADTATQFTVEYGNMPSSGVNVVNVNTGATVWTQELTSGGNGSLTLIVRPVVSPGEYVVQAFNSSRTVIATSARYTVGSVTPVPIVTIQITPSTISVGGSSTLTWTTQNANRCYMSYGSIQETVPLSGTWTINNTVTTKYTLRCVNDPGTGKDGPASEASATLTVSNTSSVGELYAVGVYEAAGAQHNFCYSKPGTVNVNLVQLIGSKKGTPITLSLSAYEPVIWNINVPAGVNLQKVILSGYNVQSPVITGASPLVERYFYNDPANASRGISPAGSFYDERDGADSRFQTIYNWAGQATCANTSGAVPIASRWYYNPGSNYFYAYQKTDSNYSTLVSKLQSMTGLTLKNFQGGYSGSSFTVTVGTPEY
ncbi:peptidoglycan-binding protein [Patescibacteria group bacterium]|nr:peptidoglycan-binding protein [Patescibacteria group bacterium]